MAKLKWPKISHFFLPSSGQAALDFVLCKLIHQPIAVPKMTKIKYLAQTMAQRSSQCQRPDKELRTVKNWWSKASKSILIFYFSYPHSFLEHFILPLAPSTKRLWQVGHFSPVGLDQSANLQSG